MGAEAERAEAERAEAERVERLLPLTPATFAILLTLASGEKHGYAIMREIAASSEGVLRVGPGTLYQAIKQLLAAGVIAETGDRSDPALDDQRRRYYQLTGFGRRLVQAEAVRLARLVREAGAQGLLGASDLQPRIHPGGIGGAR